jgi:YD repeat-containing protein
VLTSRVEVCDLYTHTEVFRSAAMYDCMNRAIAQLTQGPDGALDLVLTPSAPWHLMPSTIVSVTGYDSRSNVTVQVDPKGNTVQMAYDGASRMIESTQHMRKSGGGDQPPQPSTQGSSQSVIAKLPGAAPITSSGGGTFLPGSSSVIRTQTIYDANSRVVALIDDNGGTTNYTYDAHNRQVTMEFADGATRTNAYNACSDVMTYTDEAGNLFTRPEKVSG